MINEIIKEGMYFDFPLGRGMVINTSMKNGNFYINVAFGDDGDYKEMVFRIYQVIDKGDTVDFVEVTDATLSGELNSEWIVRGMLEENEAE